MRKEVLFAAVLLAFGCSAFGQTYSFNDLVDLETGKISDINVLRSKVLKGGSYYHFKLLEYLNSHKLSNTIIEVAKELSGSEYRDYSYNTLGFVAGFTDDLDLFEKVVQQYPAMLFQSSGDWGGGPSRPIIFGILKRSDLRGILEHYSIDYNKSSGRWLEGETFQNLLTTFQDNKEISEFLIKKGIDKEYTFSEPLTKTIIDDNVRIRKTPSTDARILGVLKRDQQVSVLGGTYWQQQIGTKKEFWLRVNADGTEGWVYGQFVDIFYR